jgi:hypothetical protein
MSGNVKFRWFLLAPILVALFVVISPVVSWAGELEDAQKKVRQNYKSNVSLAYINSWHKFVGRHTMITVLLT